LITIATTQDFNRVKELSTNFFYASPYKNMPLDEVKQNELIFQLIDKHPSEGLIACLWVDDQIQGILAGTITEILFSHSTIASDVLWWVEPKFRGTKGSFLLLECFEYWAENIAGAEIIQMVALEDDSIEKISKFYKRRGYTPVERGFIKHIARN
jgi:hypothetical protein